MTHLLSIQYYERKSQYVDSRTLYMNVAIRKKRAKGPITTGLKYSQHELTWSSEKKRFEGNSYKAIEYNQELSNIEELLQEYYYMLSTQISVLSADVLMEAFKMKRKNFMWKDGFELFCSTNKCTDSSKKTYNYVYKAIERYFGNIDLRKINAKSMAHMQSHLLKMGYEVSYTRKLLNFIKRILKTAIAHGQIGETNALLFKCEREKLREPEYLTFEEYLRVQAFSPSTYNLKEAQHLFIFQCLTGLSYVDTQFFDAEESLYKNGNRYWIKGKRKKTGIDYLIPVSRELKAFLSGIEYILPSLSNQQYNRYLKEIGKEAGLKTKLTTHVGRKTFGNLMLSKGYSIESVSKMMGHRNTTITARTYVRVRQDRIERELEVIERQEKAA